MTLSVEAADPAADRSAILGLLTEELPDWSDDARFDWLYLENPLGRARVWTLRDDSDNNEGDRLAGVSAAFPRKLVAGSTSVDAWVLGDFCIASRYRSLGPAVKLQRAVHRAVADGEIDVWYDFPSRTMMAVHERIGVDWKSELVRLVRPLRTDHAVEALLGKHIVSRGVSALGNALLASRTSFTKRDASVSVEPFSGELPPAGDVRDGKDVDDSGIRIAKTAEFSNWRYRQDPRGTVELFVAGGEDAPRGWLAVRSLENAEAVAIVDAFGIESESVLRELILAVVDSARTQSKRRVTVALSREHVWRPQFEALGFHARDTAPFIACGTHKIVVDGAPWCLMGGDRDF